MNVNLSPVFEDYIKQLLESGLYNNASEVIREALRLKMQQDEVYQSKLIALKKAVQDGLDSGVGRPLDMAGILEEAKSTSDEN